MTKLLQINHLEKYYGDKKGSVTKAIDDLSFEIDKGEFIAIMGPSGSGKTTLLNILAAIDSPSAGQILFDDMDISQLSEKELAAFREKYIGFIFQDYNLLNTLTVYENIALPMAVLGKPASHIQDLVQKTAARFKLTDLLEKYPYELSGGQQQRCACARALIKDPGIILADEPTGALDSRSSRMLMETLAVMHLKMSSTILVVTHDPLTASYCEKILFLQDGRITNQTIKGEKTQKDFFREILDTLSVWGGDFDAAL